MRLQIRCRISDKAFSRTVAMLDWLAEKVRLSFLKQIDPSSWLKQEWADCGFVDLALVCLYIQSKFCDLKYLYAHTFIMAIDQTSH